MNREVIDKVREHLRIEYAGVFDEKQIERHIRDYIGLEIAEEQVAHVLAGGPVERLLDIGSGYGTFVLVARRHGIEAIGIDKASFEVAFARERLMAERPQDKPEDVYRLGDAFTLPFDGEKFDVVTLWNVLEHVPEEGLLIREIVRVLRHGGRVYIVCPNYAAFRDEAHYHVFWPSLLPRKIASAYLRLRCRNPLFFETSVFYRTNWRVLRTLRQNGLEPHDLMIYKVLNLSAIKTPVFRRGLRILQRLRLLGIVRFGLRLALYNPLKHSVVLYALKRGVS
jgi:SAM-dependent methyltransferase